MRAFLHSPLSEPDKERQAALRLTAMRSPQEHYMSMVAAWTALDITLHTLLPDLLQRQPPVEVRPAQRQQQQ
jgi:hypothetical protein